MNGHPHTTQVMQITDSIKKELKPYVLRKIQDNSIGEKRIRTYIISLKKIAGLSLSQQTNAVFSIINSFLSPGDVLKCENCCFEITTPSDIIYYCIEAYRKNADQIAYISDDQPHSKLLYRMGCEIATRKLLKHMNALESKRYKLIENIRVSYNHINPWSYYDYYKSFHPIKPPDIENQMLSHENIEQYPNPADRYVYIIKKYIETENLYYI